jgi:hypothetical protein
MNVLVGCEESGVVRDAFRRAGHNAWSCDLVAARTGGAHIRMDVKAAIRKWLWDLIILHPDCTAMAVSGNRYYGQDMTKQAERDQAIEWTVDLWEQAKANARIGVCLENPISVIFQHLIGRLDGATMQYVEPWWFGHPEQKKTGLALWRLPRLVETNNVYRQMMRLPKNQRERILAMAPSDTRKRDRSTTFSGLADAFASQWGSLRPSKQPLVDGLWRV